MKKPSKDKKKKKDESDSDEAKLELGVLEFRSKTKNEPLKGFEICESGRGSGTVVTSERGLELRI